MSKFIVLIVVSLCLCQQVRAEAFSLDQFKALIKQNEITTIDHLLPLLPGKMLKNPILVYDSHALSLNQVSPEAPRIILFNEDASLILALTKNPGEDAIKNRKDHLEIIFFNPEQSKYEMHDIPFDGKADPVARANPVNQSLCLSCHGQNPRPIFHGYNSWPGIYGSFSQKGAAVKETKEYEFFKSFLKNRSGLKRYKDLDLSRVSDSTEGLSFASSGLGSLPEKQKFSPALVFGSLTEYLMLERLAKKLETESVKTKDFANLIAFLGRAGKCDTTKNHRDALKDLFQFWMQDSSQAEQAKVLTSKIIDTVQNDFLIKLNLLTEFNEADVFWDSRGSVNIPYLNIFNISPNADREAFINQILIIESLAMKLNLVKEDFTTDMRGSSSGIFHVRSALGRVPVTTSPLFEDEQVIKGVYDALVKINSPLIFDQMSESCEKLKTSAENEIKKLRLPGVDSRGIFY